MVKRGKKYLLELFQSPRMLAFGRNGILMIQGLRKMSSRSCYTILPKKSSGLTTDTNYMNNLVLHMAILNGIYINKKLSLSLLGLCNLFWTHLWTLSQESYIGGPLVYLATWPVLYPLHLCQGKRR